MKVRTPGRHIARAVLALCAVLYVFPGHAQLPSLPAPGAKVVKTDHLQLRYSSTPETVSPGGSVTLVAEFLLGPKMHVYTPDVKNYIPIDLKLEVSPSYTAKPAQYPKGKLMMLPAINEIVPVYEAGFRITQELTVASSGELTKMMDSRQPLKIRGTLRYQACDDKICYLPQNIPLEWTLLIVPSDAAGARSALAPSR